MASSSKLGKKDNLSPPHPPPVVPSLPQQLPSRSLTIDKTRKPHSNPNDNNNHLLSPLQEDLSLSMSSHLTRPELLRRRLHRLRRLSKVYRDHYWALMEDLRVQYREYYWKYGVSPYKEEDEREIGGENVEGCGETNNCNNNNNCAGSGGKLGLGLGLGFGEGVPELKLSGNNRCAFVGCKLKAMALTSFCQLHILSDPHQKLYKACNYVIKSISSAHAPNAGPIFCSKPILRSTIPSLCNIHFQKGQKDVSRALKKAGLNVSLSSKLAPKFHVIVAEYVRHIQSKRTTARKPYSKNIVKEESTG